MSTAIERLNGMKFTGRQALQALQEPYNLASTYRELIGRRRTYSAPEPLGGSYPETDDKRMEVQADYANLISSRETGTDMHLPVIDLDFGASLVPSSTPGHYHLYLDKAITWRAYKRLLCELYKAGIVEKGFYRLSVKRGASFVRHPARPKDTTSQAKGKDY